MINWIKQIIQDYKTGRDIRDSGAVLTEERAREFLRLTKDPKPVPIKDYERAKRAYKNFKVVGPTERRKLWKVH